MTSPERSKTSEFKDASRIFEANDEIRENRVIVDRNRHLDPVLVRRKLREMNNKRGRKPLP